MTSGLQAEFWFDKLQKKKDSFADIILIGISPSDCGQDHHNQGHNQLQIYWGSQILHNPGSVDIPLLQTYATRPLFLMIEVVGEAVLEENYAGSSLYRRYPPE